MVIEINTDTLKKCDLNANQFMLAQIIYEGHLGVLQSLLEKLPGLDSDLDILISKEFVRYQETGLNYTVTSSFIGEVRGEGKFEELLAAFPTSVIRPNGSRDYLRAGYARAKTRYNNLVKSKPRHDLVMQCLSLELSTRKLENNLGYMKRLTNWVNTQEWESWEPKLGEDPVSTNTVGYGQGLE